MNVKHMHRRLLAFVAFAAALASAPQMASAQLADLADVPLANSPSTSVLPNLMYVLDDSGSMNYNYMPDQILRTSAGVIYNHCRTCVQRTLSSWSNSADSVKTSSNHGGRARAQVTFISGTVPSGVSLNTVYYLRTVDSDEFKLETQAGVLIDLSGGSSSGAVVIICTGPGGGSDIGPFGGVPCGNDDSSNPNAAVDQSTLPTYGDPPFYAPAFNKIWYNPDITYSAGVDSTGASLGDASATAAKFDAYTDPTTRNLTSQFQELVYCSNTSPSAADLTNTNVCRYNGRHNSGAFLAAAAPTYFLYYNNTFSNATGANQGYPSRAFINRKIVTTSVPHYYRISSNEYCSDTQLTSCALANAAGNAPDASNVIAAPVRWCKTADDAQITTVVSGNSGTPATPRCRKKFDKTTHPYPRMGRFTRVDIIPSVTSYPKAASSTRSDCASAATCTYSEELQNFANWWSYYRVRLSLMKTATGKAFLSIDDRFRVGFITINPNNPVTAAKFLGVGKFDTAQRSTFYNKLYAQTTNGSTPLREALSRVGRYYAGLTSGINAGMGADPVQYSCQTNYSLLTTDGYWNGNTGDNLAGSAVGNQDNSSSGFTTRLDGAYDGNRTGGGDTLADVAAYYYKTDLRTSGLTAPNNVPTNQKDTAAHQHMVTFTLGLGLEGFMDFQSDYEVSSTGDFAKIKAGTTGCAWISGTCDWPVPAQNEPSTLDDLWHAAVNGRGAYFSASDPNSLALGLQSALAKLRVATASASASATSSPNITQTSNYIFSSTFRTGIWDGEVVAQRIDIVSGNVLPAVVWSAQAKLDAKTQPNSDSRTIFTIDEGGANGRKDFKFASLSSVPVGSIVAEQTYFANKCGALAQCTLLTLAQQAIANSGVNLVDYLRGQRQFESYTPPETIASYRTREHVLGDPVNATPVFVHTPQFSFADAVTPTYSDFKDTWVNRQAMLYIAANDGMLHAFNGDTGDEVFAYVPRITMPRIHKLANANWGATHTYTVDGSPTTMDVYYGGGWKTVMVAGLNGGGRGYYALDVTDPSAPKVLWETCFDATVCKYSDPDMGYSYGNPVITKRASDNKWVVFVTSGINNVSPGTGQGYLFTLDVQTGQVLNKVSTGFGSVAAPSGLNRIAGFADDFVFDNTSKAIYGGDLWGNVWKFDTSSIVPTVSKLAQLKDSTGKPQSITTRPELGAIDGFPVVFVGTGRYLGEDDLIDPSLLVPAQPFAYTQSLYAIKDRGVTYPNFRSGSVVQNTLIDSGTTRTTSNNKVNWALQDGWFMDFNPSGTSPGERLNLDPQLVQGILIAATNVPNNSACTVGGDSWLYFFDYRNGTFVSSSAGGIAGKKTTGEITVGIVTVRLPSGALKVISTKASGGKSTEDPPPILTNVPARRINWRELFQK